jgi:hypothetical protein
LPLWDIVFGTFKNPSVWEGSAGFQDGASLRIGAMLIGADVSGMQLQPLAADQATVLES